MLKSRLAHRLLRPLAVVFLMLSSVHVSTANADISDDDIRRARDALVAAQRSADTAARNLAAARGAAERAQDAVDEVKSRIAALERRRAELRERLRARAVHAYMYGGTPSQLSSMLSAGNAREAGLRGVYVDRVLALDSRNVDEAKALGEDLAAEEAALSGERDRLKAAAARLDGEKRRLEAAVATAAEITKRLEAQKAAEDKARAEAAARALDEARRSRQSDRASSAGTSWSPPSTDGLACPVQGGASFSNDYGAPRSGGRSHQGNDLFAPYGTTLVAITSGVVSKTGNSGLGGITVWLKGSNGVSYYYAHNSANLVGAGDHVGAGQPIAKLGNTGNAKGTSPHVHFEMHPGGGGAVNPYSTLVRIC